ncbi:hypothetical protein [Micromonospora sp. NPDC005367]|uniref:hypothetical protein n=1 Tax=Micromonospora sp. NPDC005367 TaxID=3155590 RepID=UPI0033BDC4F4
MIRRSARAPARPRQSREGVRLDPLTYDDRGNTLEVKNGKNAKVTQAYDTFGRPKEKVEPLDAANNRFITTKAPEYDANDKS